MLLAGNIISFLGCLLMVAIGFVKKKKHILVGQCAQFSVQAVGHFLLNAHSAVLSCLVSIVRILVFNRFKKVPAWLKVAFLVFQTVLNFLLGARTFYDWVPVLSMVLYTWYLDTEDAVIFKFVNMAGLVMWIFHDFHYQNFAAFGFDILTVISTTVGIVLILRDRAMKRR